MESFWKFHLLILPGVFFFICLCNADKDLSTSMEMGKFNAGFPVKMHFQNSSSYLSFETTFNPWKPDYWSEPLKYVYHDFEGISSSETSSLDCFSDVQMLVNSTKAPIELKLQYLDASTKIPTGVLQNKWNWVGDYQECLGIKPFMNPDTGKTFKGQYFSSVIYVNGKPVLGPYPIVLGICLPNSCSEKDANNVVNTLIFYLKDEIKPYFANDTIYSALTVADKPQKLESGAKAMLSVTAVIGFIVLISTIVDYFTIETKKEEEPAVVQEDSNNSESNVNDTSGLLTGELFSPSIQRGRCETAKLYIMKLCQAFSVVSNGKKLFGTSTAVGPLACLNGIRVLSMWWVILGHSYAFVIAVADNIIYAGTYIQRFSFQPIMNGTFSVDSFFFLSGLLVAYLALNEINEKGKLNWIYYVLHRYWRLSPLYLYVIFYFTYLMSYTISGPLAFFVMQGPYKNAMDVCKNYWWTNLLYINNMYPKHGSLDGTCMGWGWYLANDMQFYLIFGPILIILFRKFRIVGVITTGFLIICGVGIRAFLVWYYGLYGFNNAPTKHVDDPWGAAGAIYGRPYARWSVYLVGMLTGYYLSVTRNRIRIHKVLALFGWCAAIATGLAVVYGQYYYNHHPNTHMTLTASIFYISLSRTAWSLCLSWIVIACVSGNGGPVKDILSWTIWAPLGRLTYSAYLIHPIVMYTFYFNMRENVHVADLLMVYFFIGHLVISYAVAFVVSMLVEAPMIQLEKLLLKPARLLGEKVLEIVQSLNGRFKNLRRR